MATKKVLEGLRVLDFTWSLAGPGITRNLAALGAEVIKVEWPANPDILRTSMYKAGEEKLGLDNGAYFNWINVGKKGFSINARHPEGLEIIKELVKKCDIVSESFSAKVFENWGLSYEELKKLNPRIIYISVSGFGHSGRNSDMYSFGPTAQAYNGLTFMSGLPEKEPAGWGWAYMDIMAAYQATNAVLMAIYHLNRTGEGQYIDVSQVESGIPLTGATILDYTVNGRKTNQPGFPPGNWSISPGKQIHAFRGETGAPYNVYPCKGKGMNDFCVISVITDEQWKQFKKALGNPEWAEKPYFDTANGRIDHQEELDTNISQWTIQYDKCEVMELLQGYGVPSGAVQSPEDRMEYDPQAKHRNIFPTLEHPLLGSHRFEGIPFQMSEAEPVLVEHWPFLGQDNDYVLGELLGLSKAEIQDLEERGITWPKNMPKDTIIEASKW